MHELNHTWNSDAEFYSFKLQAVLSSLPQNFPETQMWTEFGSPPQLVEHHPGAANRIVCYTAHNNDQLAEEISKHPGIKIIKLVNHHRFNELCFELKSKTSAIRQKVATVYGDELSLTDHFELNVDTLYPNRDDFITEAKKLRSQHRARSIHWDRSALPGHFDFDMDTIYSVDAFLAEVKRLYDFLELDDFQPDLVQQFHQSYLKLHNLA
jgi:hypothetical protein